MLLDMIKPQVQNKKQQHEIELFKCQKLDDKKIAFSLGVSLIFKIV